MRKNYLWFNFFRFTIVKNGLKFFYKKIIINGLEKVPKDKPLLILPNHQNSFMDAFLVVTNIKTITYFLTRAQAFNPPIIGKFLRSINLVPVFRARDGLSSVTKNNAIFEECIEYLKMNQAILIFPEANHNLKRRIRPLSKGFTRIAFDAEVQENWKMDLHVIPAGVNYYEHENIRNIVRVEIGDPILVKDFEEMHKKDERKAANLLKDRVSEEMKKLTMHVANLDHYNVCKILIADMELDVLEVINPNVSNERVAKIEANITPEIVEVANHVSNFSEEHKFNLKTIIGRERPITTMVLLFPFYLFSWINNIIPYQPVRILISKVIKDHAFDASIKFLASLVLFPLFWIVITSILWLVGLPSLYVWGYLILSLFTSVLFKDANLLVRERKEKTIIEKLKSTHPKEYEEFEKGLMKLNEFRKEVL